MPFKKSSYSECSLQLVLVSRREVWFENPVMFSKGYTTVHSGQDSCCLSEIQLSSVPGPHGSHCDAERRVSGETLGPRMQHHT
jgi:hypothetical protein